jgi:hypothetical protein
VKESAMRKRALIVASLSLALAALWAGPARAEDKETEENEQRVSVQDVPDEVRATLIRESFGAHIKTVDLEKRDGKTVYEADAKIDGENYEIVISKNGKLISKKIDNEEAEQASEKKESRHASSAKDDGKPKAKARKREADDAEKPAKKKEQEREEDNDKE